MFQAPWIEPADLRCPARRAAEGYQATTIQPHTVDHLDAIVALSLRSWAPVDAGVEEVMDPEVYGAMGFEPFPSRGASRSSDLGRNAMRTKPFEEAVAAGGWRSGATLALVAISIATGAGWLGAELVPLVASPPEAEVCPDPNAPCSSPAFSFAEHDLSFVLPEKLAWQSVNPSKPFYAVLLASAGAVYPDPVDPDDETPCGGFVAERERLAVQARFPKRKVFASRHGCSMVWYNGVDDRFNVLAVYAGTSLEQAREVLRAARALGAYPDANIRRMQVVVDTVH